MDEKLNNNYRKNEPVMNSSKLGSDSVSNVKNLKNEADLLQQNSSTAESLKSEDNPNISHYRKWNAEDVIYNEGGDFKAELDPAQRHEYDSYFATQYSQDVRVQYPTDAVFRPPLVSTLQYKYNFVGTQLHRQKPSAVPPAAPLVNHDHHAQASNSSFHPNMWYPNAPYDSSSVYSCGQNRYPLYGTAGYINDHLVDMHHLSNSGREARNRAEKNRRDKLNGSIQELSTMVPHVAESPRRVDKTAVLRFAAHGLRLQYAFRDALNAPKPQLTDSLMKLLDSFFITLTCHGQIILISSSIEQHLGHCQTDLYGQNILHITHPEDHDLIRQQLIPSDLENLFEIPAEGRSEEPSQRTQAEEEYIDQKLREDKRSFTVRLARAGPRSESTSYEVVKIDGCFRRSDGAPRGVKTNSPPSGLQLVRRTQRREEALPVHTISGNDIVLIAIARVIHPPKLVKKMMDANSLEYKTRHLIDGRIIDCDQRIGIVAGYMTDEVRNLSPFTFMHQDDVRWVIVALRQMYDCNSSYGESTYRLLTRNGYFIYLLSKGYLEIDKETNTVHSFVCVNTLLDEEEGRRRVHEMKNKFSVIINKQIPSSSIDVPASENPQQLVRAVLCLIQNLQKTSPDDEEVASVSDLNNSSVQQNSCTTMSSSSNRSAKTPPLALVPPEPSSVKTSISKSVNVVNVTAAKHLLGKKQENKTPTDEGDKDIGSVGEDSYGCDCPHGEDGVRCEECTQRRSRISKLKRSIASPESADFGLMKRRFKSNEIQHVIFSSLDQLGRSLQEQQNAAIELQDQSNKFEVPNAKNRIKAIMEECQKQNEMYVNITSEIQSQGMEPNTTNSGADSQNAINLNQR